MGLSPRAEGFVRRRPEGGHRRRGWAAALFFVAAFLWLSPHPLAQEPPPKPASPLQEKLGGLLQDSCLTGARVGVHVLSLDNEEVLYDRRGEELFVPASNVKLFVSAAALRFLESDYVFKTDLHSDTSLSEGTLEGNLYLKGFGDPSLVSEELSKLVTSLRALGLRKVRENLVIDASYFSSPPSPPPSPTKTRAYLAPHGAASLNFNAVAVYAEPGASPGQPPRVVLEPASPYFELLNRAKTVRGGKRKTLRVRREALSGSDRIIVEGNLPSGSPRELIWVSISNPAFYLGHTFVEFLQRGGISVEGEVRLGPVPPEAGLLFQHRSKSLASILWDMNKWSNNFMAQQILHVLGAEAGDPPGTVEKGVAVVESYLKRLGVSGENFEMADGSGLSRENRLSPGQLVKVLQDMYGDFRYRSEFVSSLSVMGVDGSTRDRLEDTRGERRVRVKTGSLKGVDTLSGYAVTGEGEVLAFSILMNGSSCPHWKVKVIQDQMALALVHLNRGFSPARTSPSR